MPLNASFSPCAVAGLMPATAHSPLVSPRGRSAAALAAGPAFVAPIGAVLQGRA